MQATPNAANPGAIAAAVGTGGAVPIAATVANAIVTLTRAGATPDKANERVAEQLDAAAAQAIAPSVAEGAQASRPAGMPVERIARSSGLPAAILLYLDWRPTLEGGLAPSWYRIDPWPRRGQARPLMRVLASANTMAALV